jgi:hypothetical protein
MNNQEILDKARLLLGIQFTARSFDDLDGVYSHERVIKATDFLISEISKRDERIAELEEEGDLELEVYFDDCETTPITRFTSVASTNHALELISQYKSEYGYQHATLYRVSRTSITLCKKAKG